MRRIKVENILIRKQVIPSLDSLLNLYNDISWTTYTSNPNQLELALKNSLKVWTAWDGDLLVGLARVIGDGSTIIYIQDILVLKAYQRRGIGSHFITTILDEYEDIRQIILLTEDNQITKKFYEKNGLNQVGKYDCVAYMK